jgi:hypothetical protein
MLKVAELNHKFILSDTCLQDRTSRDSNVIIIATVIKLQCCKMLKVAELNHKFILSDTCLQDRTSRDSSVIIIATVIKL